MIRLLLWSIILPVFACCQQRAGSSSTVSSKIETEEPYDNQNKYTSIIQIPVPEGFLRVQASPDSFAAYLRNLPLKKDKTVYLYNGQPKSSQDAQYAVINISVGKKDLQQCADAIMRLRAEYLYSRSDINEIKFFDNANTAYRFKQGGTRKEFDQYMEKVFSYCGTLSLEKQLRKRQRMDQVTIGDVLIQGGSPGHAMLVVDMAVDKEGNKIILLSQGYMPAQDVHIVRNPKNGKLSPWYRVDNESYIYTPEWTFKPSQLRHW
jgi:hypothetical protein